MIVVCPKCSSQIQVSGSDSERPPRIRCPKCNVTLKAATASSAPEKSAPTVPQSSSTEKQRVKAQVPGSVSPASEKSALTVGQSPSTERQRFIARVPAPLFELGKTGASEAINPTAPPDEMNQLLANLVKQLGSNSSVAPNSRPVWNPRRVLVCTGESYRDVIAHQLSANGYRVFVAYDTGQAVDRMRENQLDVVLLDSEFDAAEQGSAFVVREVNVLRPAQRRRIFFVLLSPTQRTMDAHAAFLHSVNAIVNLKDVDDLFRILEHALREYNELYKEFHQALNVPAL